MNTSLGVSPQLGGGEVDAELIRSARILYLEGYLFDRPEAKAAFRQAADIAAKAGRQVALSLSDPFCVDRHRPEFLKLIKESVDILFANEAEIISLYETPLFDDAARQAQTDTKLAALTRSEKGSVILSGGKSIAIPAAPVPRWWTPPAPAISMRRDSCSAWQPARTSRRRAGSAAWRRRRSSPTSARGRR